MNYPKMILYLFLQALFIVSMNAQLTQPLSLSEQLAFSTVRLEVLRSDKKKAYGTAFIFSFLQDSIGDVPVIVTNKHVIKKGIKGTFILTQTNSDGTPNLVSHIPIVLDNFESRWILHPDTTIDIAVMPIAPVLIDAAAKGVRPFYRKINKNLIPSDDNLKQLNAIEEVIMVGYPVGLIDNQNNYPIFRKGITATHPNLKYNGKDEFMIDAACFPGSSGSPVFLLNQGNYGTREGSLVAGERIYFLGILYGGPQYTANGEIKILNIPAVTDTITQTNIPINLGNIIRSRQLLQFENIFKQLLNKK